MSTLKTGKPSSTVMVADNQLPIWANELRGIPNSLARSALFTVANVRKGKRANLKRQPIASLKGIEITYTGEELRQDDEDVFLQLLHLARLQEVETQVTFSAGAMINELGWSRNTKSYTRLAETLDRLTATNLSVTATDGNKQANFFGSLIGEGQWIGTIGQDSQKQWSIQIPKRILVLFNPEGYTKLGWKLRMRLPPLAKWLHSFYHSHRTPYGYKVETLRALTGTEIKQLYVFRFKLKEALALLCEEGFFTSARVDDRTDLVMVERADLAHLAN